MKDLTDFLPRARLEAFPQQYMGTNGVQAISSIDRDRLLITSRETPPAQRAAQSAAASGDIYADMDFRTFLTDGGLQINPGEISWVSWGAAEWAQEYEVVPETEILVTATAIKQYLHLIIPIVTKESTPSDIVTPWFRQEGSFMGTPWAYAMANNWQSLDGAPFYRITALEEPNAATEAGSGTIMDVLLASLDTPDGLRVHHAGPVTLSQGHAADLVSITP